MKVFVLLAIALPALSQPVISSNGVVNGASYAGPQTTGANVPVAQGSIIAIFGQNLGPSQLNGALSLPLTATLTGTSVKVAAGGASYDAWMLYTSANQVGAIVPSNVPVGPASLTVIYNGQTGVGQPIAIVPANFGIFTQNSAGYGPGSIQNYVNASTTPQNALTIAANPGQVLTLYGTGLGASLDGNDNNTPKTGNISTHVVVSVAGVSVTPSYAGRSSQYPGLDQINFQLPASVAWGCYVPVTVSVGTTGGNLATLAISQTSACTHPLGLSAASLATLDAGGTVPLGVIHVSRFGLYSLTQTDSVNIEFFGGNANTVFLESSGGAVPVAAGSCVTYSSYAMTGVSQRLFSFLPYDAGSSLSLVGPGTNAQLLGNVAYSLTSNTSAFLTNGAWSVSGTGGAQVGPFTANFTLPTMPQWTNSSAFNSATISRASGATVTWSGGGPSDVMRISGASVLVDPANPANSAGQTFVCSAPASVGTFTVPAAILQTMPAYPGKLSTLSYSGTLTIATATNTPFTAPLTAGGSLAGSAVLWNYTNMQLVNWQ